VPKDLMTRAHGTVVESNAKLLTFVQKFVEIVQIFGWTCKFPSLMWFMNESKTCCLGTIAWNL
jgi:hypothetical protein